LIYTANRNISTVLFTVKIHGCLLILLSIAVLLVLKAADIFFASVAGNDIQIQNTVHASVQYVQISERQTLVTEK